jgi:hypothetical protein
VAYAGSADYSIDIIRQAPSQSLGETLEFLQSQHIESNEDIDFIVACAEQRTLFCIREGCVTPVHRECLIGDADAFEQYAVRQAVVQVPADVSGDAERITRAIQAFYSVIGDDLAPTVGGLMIRVGSRPQGFVHLSQALAFYPSQTIPSGIPTSLSFGGRADGGFAYTLLVPEAAGIPLMAVHFFQGALGYVYAPLTHDKPIQFSNVSHEELRSAVLTTFGVVIDGPRIG